MKPCIVYVLHSGNLYGTEKMALVTLQGLQKDYALHLLAPPGPVHQAATDMSIAHQEFLGTQDLFKQLLGILKSSNRIAFFATGVVHSLLFIGLNVFLRRKSRHFHLVHGGTDERLSYGRKHQLNFFDVQFIAVSAFVRDRLLAHQVNPDKIKIVENFLPDEQINQAQQRLPFTRVGIQNILIISRVDPIKRIDLLLDTLDQFPQLNTLNFKILGTGWDLEKLSKRAKQDHPNVTFVGYSDQVADELAQADLLLHLCPVEPFGLAILEAMAAKVPVLLPNQGGASGLVENGISGFHFKADNAADLALQLKTLQAMNELQFNQTVENAYLRLQQKYSASAKMQEYQDLLKGL